MLLCILYISIVTCVRGVLYLYVCFEHFDDDLTLSAQCRTDNSALLQLSEVGIH